MSQTSGETTGPAHTWISTFENLLGQATTPELRKCRLADRGGFTSLSL